MTSWTDYQDDISDAISDSMDVDWSASVGARAVVAWLNEHGPISAAPAPEGGAVSSALREMLALVLLRYGNTDEAVNAAVERAQAALATREEAPAGAGEDAEAIVRRWANWIIDESSDMDHDDHDAGKRKIRAERDFILSALRAQPQAREDAQPWAYGWYDSGGGKRVYAYLPTVSAFPEANAFPLYTHPAPDALRVAVEALEAIRALGLGPDRGAANWRAEQAQEIASQALAALQAEQKGGA